MRASEWIDQVKAARGWESDYRAAKELGLSKATVSAYRTRSPTMDEDVAVKVAAALGKPPELVILDQAAERSRSPEARGAIMRALSRLSAAGLAALAVGVGGGLPSPAQASDATPVCIMSNGVKRRRKDSPATVAGAMRRMADGLLGLVAPPHLVVV